MSPIRAAVSNNSGPQAKDRIAPAVTVADAIGMTKVGGYAGAARFSPDGKKFVIVLKRGNIERNTNDYSLLLWRTDDAFAHPVSQLLLTVSSSSNRPAIEAVSWLADGNRILFLGENPGELHQLYVYDILARTLRKLTNHPTNLTSYSTTPDGNETAFTAEEPTGNIFDEKARRFGVVVLRQAPESLVLQRDGGAGYGHDQLFLQSVNGVESQLHPPNETSHFGHDPRLSPDGEYLAVATYVEDIPVAWREYSDAFLRRAIDLALQQQVSNELQVYVLFNTKTAAGRILLNSPLSNFFPSEAAWSPDSRSLVITNTFLPPGNTQDEERRVRTSKSFTVEINASTREIARISDEELYGVEWGSKAHSITAHGVTQESNTTYGPGETLYFRKGASGWEKIKGAVLTGDRPEIVIEQDFRTPPKIVAIDLKTHGKSVLLDLNPQLGELRLARIEEIEWRGRDGHAVKGGLYYPVDYVPGQRYPLVIQTHGWDAHQFWIDGPYTTAFAAQPLAGKNIMVLQTDMSLDGMGTPSEGPRETAAYEGAIDALDKNGLIDRNRVGLIGFSRTCYHVKYALTHSSYKFAAASVTAGIDAGYLQYILSIASFPQIAQDSDGIYGGPPSGESLKSWMQGAPGFNVEKVRSPILITAQTAESVIGEWEWFATLTRLRKPVDMIMLQDGSHPLEKPWDRMVSQQGTVEWFCFWLKGEEDPDPAKAEQYDRWRELRKLQEQNQSKAPAN